MKQLLPYQREDAERIKAQHFRVLLASEMGCGKTPITVTAISESRMFPALIVCPPSLKENWAKEFRDWAGIDPQILSGETPTEVAEHPVTIISYNLLQHWFPELAKIQWRVVAFDECHALADRTTATTKFSKKISLLARGVIGISGTPVTNHVADFWPILNIIRPGSFPSFAQFAHRHCEPCKKFYGWEYKGAANLEELHDRIMPFTIRRLKKVVLNLPEKRHIVVPLEIEEIDEYNQLDNEFQNWIARNRHGGKITGKTKAEALVRLGALMMFSARLKCKYVGLWARKYLADNPGKKLIVFCTHTGMLNKLAEKVLPGGTVVIDGSVATSKRQAIVEQFQNNPEVRLMVANVKSAGVGLTLTAASAVAHAELWWTPSATSQSSDRIHRIGQEENCLIYYLIVPGTVEEKLCEAIQTKSTISNIILDGGKGDTMPVLDTLFRKIGKK